MNEKKAVRGKPHKIEPSPCDSCRDAKGCRNSCEKWRAWVADVWPVVTGRRANRE